MVHEILLRQAYLPIDDYLCLLEEARPDTHATELLQTLLQQDSIRTALQVGAPRVYDYLSGRGFSAIGLSADWQATLWKYITRMHSRATPYGLFAAVGLPAPGVRSGMPDHGMPDQPYSHTNIGTGREQPKNAPAGKCTTPSVAAVSGNFLFTTTHNRR